MYDPNRIHADLKSAIRDRQAAFKALQSAPNWKREAMQAAYDRALKVESAARDLVDDCSW